MTDEFRPVASAANHAACDFCNHVVVGWVRVGLPNRGLGGIRDVQIFMVCARHLELGEPVYPYPRGR